MPQKTKIAILGIGAVGGGALGQKFNVSGPSFASSVTAYFRRPTSGDSISAELYTFSSAPGTLIASTGKYYFTPNDALVGVTVNLGFTSAPYQIAAGTYFVAVKEYGNNVTMGYTSFNFQTNTAFYRVGAAGAWTPVESPPNNFTSTFIMRLNVLDPLFVGVPSVYKQDVFTMHPNPASFVLNVNTKGNHPEAILSLYDITGREVFNQIGVAENNTINLQKFTEGIYVVRMVLNGSVYSEKVTITK